VLKDDLGELTLRSYGVPATNIDFAPTFSKMLKTLMAHRVDAISYHETSARWLIKNKGLNPNDFEVVRTNPTDQHYFAFNLLVEDSVVEAHQAALDKVKSNPSVIQSIDDKYLGKN